MQHVPDVPPRAAGSNRTAVIAIAVGSALVILTVVAVVILLVSLLRPAANSANDDRDDDRSSSEEADADDDEEDEEEQESDAPLTSDLTGLWTGEVTGDPNPYSLRVTIKDDGSIATAIAEYPEIPCTGTWSLSSRTDEEVVFVEKMPLENVCYDQVVIQLTPNDDGSLSYSAVSDTYNLSATLVRQD